MSARILAVDTYRVSVGLHTPFVTSRRRAETAESLLVAITDSDGQRGWGESPQVWQVTGESLAGAAAAIEGPLRQPLLGSDPDDLAGLSAALGAATVANQSAKAALEVALHDLTAVRLGIPLARLLGGPATRLRVATDVTLPVGSVADLRTAAQARVRDGFGALKVKVGTDARGDVDRVQAVRDAVGPDVAIRLDANQGWTPKAAVTSMLAIEAAGCDVECVEQPVAAADLAGMAFVTARIATPVMADESVYGVRDLVRVITDRAADLVNIKLAKCGGLRTAGAMLELAHAYGVATMVGSMMETHVGVGAAAALVAATSTPATAALSSRADLDAAWWLRDSPVTGGLTYAGPELVLADAPGLGITGLRGCDP